MDEILTEKITSLPAVSSPRLESPRAPATGDIPQNTENSSPIVNETPVAKELHKFDANSPGTTTAITKETPSVIAEIDRPAAGAGGSSTNPRAVTRGRRHVRTNLFESDGNNIFGIHTEPSPGFVYQTPAVVSGNTEGLPQNREIFSVKGTRSIQINRHRDNVSVFPSGCMGINNATTDNATSPDECSNKEETNEISPKAVSNETTASEVMISPDKVAVEATKVDQPPTEPVKPIEKNTIAAKPSTADELSRNSSITGCGQRRTRPLSAVQRNPLTGVGYEEQDFIRQSSLKKKDGNPVLGHGYAPPDNRTKKVPPGGYSTGLW